MVALGACDMTTDSPFAAHEALEPATIRILVAAYENALQSLDAMDSEHLDPYSTRQTIAKHIITLALAGERDMDRLCTSALDHLRRRASAR